MAVKTDELAKKLFSYAKNKESAVNIFSLHWWNRQLLSLGMADKNLKDQLFRFVDVLPALKTEKEINKYLIEYLSDWNRGVSGLLKKTTDINGVDLLSSAAIKLGVKIMAKTFIVGKTVTEVREKIQILNSKGLSYTLDLLGELVVSEQEAKEHLDEYIDLIRNVESANISVKLSGLYSQINPMAFEDSKAILKDRLRMIYREAKDRGAFVNVDLEHYSWKDLFIAVVTELLVEDEFRDWDGAGIVVQAYLRDSRKDLQGLISWAKKRGTKIMVRLVKGAYWDYEKTVAEQNNWRCPVYIDKAETDLNYEELTELLFENYQYIKPAIASHNIRSLANALTIAKNKGLDKSEFEFQMLYGMLDSVKEYFAKEDLEIRVYLPYGELIPGMAYLVRRLLENTANESFLTQGFSKNMSVEKLLTDPKVHVGQYRKDKEFLFLNNFPHIKEELDEDVYDYIRDFVNDADSDFSKDFNRADMKKALVKANSLYGAEKRIPLLINGEKIFTENTIDSINPSKFKQVLAKVSLADEKDAELAMSSAQKAFKSWSKVDIEIRAKVLKDTANEIRDKRFDFNAILVLEGGKPWNEADAEVSEIIDMLDYYADQALRFYKVNELVCLSGEKNTSAYMPVGVSAVIPPWNFPLAIMGGMAAASLVAGNTVIIKPASQTPVVAYEFSEILASHLAKNLKGKMPADLVSSILTYLPGPGRSVGNMLVEDARVKLIAFTGSCEVGMDINKKVNSNPKLVKHLIAEMGGKNTIIVDETADLDEAIPGVLYSAFGYAGQKCSACSRVVVMDSIYDKFVSRLAEAAASIVVEDGANPISYLPSVIDKIAHNKVKEYIEIGKKEATMVMGPKIYEGKVPEDGFFLPPSIFADVLPDSRLSQEEIFGPVLSVIRASDIEDAIEITNNTRFGLTGGLFSRSPENIAKVSRDIEVGNFYINRHCTGAIVGRQAFGGMKLSSIGFKAGGPNYLLQFMKEKTITENTMRQGFTVD